MTVRYYNDPLQSLLRTVMAALLVTVDSNVKDRKARRWIPFIAMVICGTVCMLLNVFWENDLSLHLSIAAYAIWSVAGIWGAVLFFCPESRLLQAEFDVTGPKLGYLQIRDDGWELHEDSDNDRSWYTPTKACARLQLRKSYDWPFNPDDEGEAWAYFEKESKDLGGVLIDLKCEEVCGLQAISGVFKYRLPTPVERGMYYMAVTWIPFDGFTYQINFESGEIGETGIREVVVAFVKAHKGEGLPEPGPVVEGEPSQEEIAKMPAPSHASDSSEYDDQFPDHPLSEVRAYQREFRETVVVDDILLSIPQYRYDTELSGQV